MKCPKCGKEISKTWLSKKKSCPNCGAEFKTREGKLAVAAPKPKKAKPTAAWYLAAYFGMIVGGIIGYLRVKDRDKGMATKLIGLGVLATFLFTIKITWFFAPELFNQLISNIWILGIIIVVVAAAKITFIMLLRKR